MGIAYLHGNGGGGNALNFRVFGVTYAPYNPKPNDIWVNTDTRITSYIFSVDAPKEPMPGMVWFATGTSSLVAFNALKKNSIPIYPLYAMQYIGGAWVRKITRIYIDGAWVDWLKYLYKTGEEFTHLTGGWDVGETNNRNTVTKSTNYIQLQTSSDLSTSRIHIAPQKAIDFTGYNTLNARVNVTTRSGTANNQPFTLRFGYGSSRTTNLASTTTKTELKPDKAGEYTLSYDIKAVNGEYYPIFGTGWYGTVRVLDIWRE